MKIREIIVFNRSSELKTNTPWRRKQQGTGTGERDASTRCYVKWIKKLRMRMELISGRSGGYKQLINLCLQPLPSGQ